jgi:hypothetical protein
MRKVVVLAMGVALLLVGSASAAKPPAITNIRYSPKPLYNDEVVLTISFTATRQAKPGSEWGVRMNIFGKEPVLSCTSKLISYDPQFGGNRRRHMQRKGNHSVALLGHAWPGIPDSVYFCRGKAEVWIVEHKLGSDDFEIAKGGIAEFRVAEAP